VYAVNFRGHETNFCEAKASCHRAKAEARYCKAEVSKPHKPQGLNIPVVIGVGLALI